MKYFSGVFALLGVVILMVELSIFNNQCEIMKRDFDTNRLAIAIQYAEECAFANSLKSGNISSDYIDSLKVTCDPTNTLDIFSAVMCANYNMAVTSQNKQTILNSIDAACLVNNDGYYIALLSTIKDGTAQDKEVVSNEKYEFKWSPKLPFSMELKKSDGSPINATIGFDLHNADLDIYDQDAKRVYQAKGSVIKSIAYEDVTINEETIKIQKTTTDGVYYYDGGKFSPNLVSDKVKWRSVNNKIADAINYNISVVSEKRGGSTYNVHLSSKTTQDGINPVIGNSLIVVISNADYARKAQLTEAVISGHRVTDRLYIIGFEENGVKYYCKNGQLPLDDNGEIPMVGGLPKYVVEKKYLTESEAALEGYHPHYTYLQIPLDRN